GAGVFGPFTRAKMNEVLAQKGYAKRLIAEKRTTLAAQAPLDEQKAEEKEPLFAADLDPGTSSPLVKKLQTVLKDFGYYNGMVTTEYFGEKTRDAVIAFQIDKGIISSPSDIGAGRIGPQTRELLNSLI
ncbi:MAG: peptidoglycan-binding domain-containing protein, partial [Patescibacteria group bacterium]